MIVNVPKSREMFSLVRQMRMVREERPDQVTISIEAKHARIHILRLRRAKR